MKLKNLFIAACVALTPLALFWGCNKVGQPVSPANSSGFTINLLNSSAQFVGAAQNTILYNISGSGAPVTGSYGPLSSAAVTGAISFNVPLPGSTSSYNLISIQINNISSGVPLALGAAPFSTSSSGISVELGPLNKTCYEVNNFPIATYFSFQNNTFSTSSTGMDTECNLNANRTVYDFYDPASASSIAYLGNGNLVNFDLVPPASSFKTQGSISKSAVLGTTTALLTPTVNDVYCIKLKSGGYAWLQITNAGSLLTSTGPSFVFRLNTTISYFSYQQSTADLSGACGSGSYITPTPTPYAPLAFSASGVITGNDYGIAVYPYTGSAAASVFVCDALSGGTGTAYIHILNSTLTSLTSVSTGGWPQGVAVNSTGTILYVSSPYYGAPPSVKIIPISTLSSLGSVGNGVLPPPFNPTPGPDTTTAALLGEMAVPNFVAVAPNSGTYPNGLFVTDSDTNGVADVLVFGASTPGGAFTAPVVGDAAVTYWNGQIGTSASPAGIATDGTTVYVADAGHNQIETYTVNGVVGNTWTTDNNPAGSKAFAGPQGIAVDSALGELFIADTNNNRVVEMTTTGVFKASWGTWGLGTGVTPSTFNLPTAVAVDGASPPNVYVADSGNSRVLKFLGL